MDGRLEDFFRDMEDTLMEVDTGAALAAPQIGVLARIVAINQSLTCKSEDEKVRAIPPIVVNPKIISHEGKLVPLNEGCLSFPGIFMKVARWPQVTVEYETVLGWGSSDGKRTYQFKTETYEGFWAQVFQHEIDHLDGKLFVDALPVGKRLAIAKKMGAKR